MLFVHPDKNAQNITEFFGEVEQYLGPHVPEELIEISRKERRTFLHQRN